MHTHPPTRTHTHTHAHTPTRLNESSGQVCRSAEEAPLIRTPRSEHAAGCGKVDTSACRSEINPNLPGVFWWRPRQRSQSLNVLADKSRIAGSGRDSTHRTNSSHVSIQTKPTCRCVVLLLSCANVPPQQSLCLCRRRHLHIIIYRRTPLERHLRRGPIGGEQLQAGSSSSE